MTTVVAGLIVREGRLLICQRTAAQSHPLKWEFPGGKVELREEPAAALERELREELNIEVTVGPEIARYAYQYPGRGPILLLFYRITEFHGEPQNQIFARMEWEAPERLPEFDFLDGDAEFVRRLACANCARSGTAS